MSIGGDHLNPKILLLFAFLLLDFTLLPWLVQLPIFSTKFEIASAIPKWLAQMKSDPFYALKQLFIDGKYRSIWLWAQLLWYGLYASLIWKVAGFKKNKVIDGVGGPDAAGGGQFGTSRWQTDVEMDTKATVWYTTKDLVKGGIVLGADDTSNGWKVWLDTEDTHSLIIGTSRSGKTRRLIFPSIWELAKAGESMILTDPKGELYKTTNKYLRKMGFKVVLLDFRNPGRGNRWNPMFGVNDAVADQDIALATEKAWDIAHMLTPKSGSGDPIWRNGEESTIAALILSVAMEADRNEQKHLSTVYNMLTELGETIQTDEGEFLPLSDYFRDLPMGHPAKLAYTTAKIAPYRTRASFMSSASSDLRLFADPNIAYLTAEQDHDLAAPGREKTAVFLVVPDEKSTRHFLASTYVDQTYQELVALANQYPNDRLPVRVNFILDEFGNMPPIPDFQTKITVSLGRGIRYHMVVQDFAQLDDKYGKNARTIRGNCHTWIYLLTTDDETAQKISNMTGQYTIQTESQSSSIRDNDSNMSRSSSHNLAGRALLMKDEILRWPMNQSLVIRARQFPTRMPLPDLSAWPANTEFEMDETKHTRQITSVEYWLPDMFAPVAATQELPQKEPKRKSIFDSDNDNNSEVI